MSNGTNSERIELIGVGKEYSGKPVVQDVDLVIEEGEFVSLLGPSGSGKTTTLMMIAGFVHNDRGQILIGGRDISQVPPRERGFGMVFQNYALFPHMTVAQNVEFPLKARKVPAAERAERVRWALETVKLEDFADRTPKQLSGGQQQRVALARAIVYHPKVVLMDEPLGALDKNLRYHMQTEIKDIQRRLGMTVIYVTHDQEEAMNMSDRIAIMRDGRMAQIGSATDVYQNPNSAFVGKFLGEANLLAIQLTGAGKLAFAGTELLAQRSAASTTAGEGYVFVRPEKLRIAKAISADFANRLTVEVARVSYLGNILRYAVKTQGQELTVDVQNLSGMAAHHVGDQVEIGWNEADCVLLPKDEPAAQAAAPGPSSGAAA